MSSAGRARRPAATAPTRKALDREVVSPLAAEPPWVQDLTEKHALAGIHSHAAYPSDEDLARRLAVAGGEFGELAQPQG